MMKRVMFLIGGGCWFLFALGFGFFLVQYVVEGAGLQFFGPVVSSMSVVLGLVHVVGFCVGMILCFAVGAGLCAHGLVLEPENSKLGWMKHARMVVRRVVMSRPMKESDSVRRCVCCRAELAEEVRVCPGCGWRQP